MKKYREKNKESSLTEIQVQRETCWSAIKTLFNYSEKWYFQHY